MSNAEAEKNELNWFQDIEQRLLDHQQVLTDLEQKREERELEIDRIHAELKTMVEIWNYEMYLVLCILVLSMLGWVLTKNWIIPTLRIGAVCFLAFSVMSRTGYWVA